MGPFSYNSVIFSTISANNFITLSAGRDFLSPNVTEFNLVSSPGYSPTPYTSQLDRIQLAHIQSDLAGSLYRKAKLGILEKLDAQLHQKLTLKHSYPGEVMSYY